jgi:hypothetical protein
MRKRQDYGDDVQVPGFSYSDGGDGGNGIDDVSSAAESLFGNRDDSDTAESENSDDEDVATKKTSAKTPVKKPVKTPVKTPAAEDTDQDASQGAAKDTTGDASDDTSDEDDKTDTGNNNAAADEDTDDDDADEEEEDDDASSNATARRLKRAEPSPLPVPVPLPAPVGSFNFSDGSNGGDGVDEDPGSLFGINEPSDYDQKWGVSDKAGKQPQPSTTPVVKRDILAPAEFTFSDGSNGGDDIEEDASSLFDSESFQLSSVESPPLRLPASFKDLKVFSPGHVKPASHPSRLEVDSPERYDWGERRKRVAPVSSPAPKNAAPTNIVPNDPNTQALVGFAFSDGSKGGDGVDDEGVTKVFGNEPSDYEKKWGVDEKALKSQTATRSAYSQAPASTAPAAKQVPPKKPATVAHARAQRRQVLAPSAKAKAVLIRPRPVAAIVSTHLPSTVTLGVAKPTPAAFTPGIGSKPKGKVNTPPVDIHDQPDAPVYLPGEQEALQSSPLSSTKGTKPRPSEEDANTAGAGPADTPQMPGIMFDGPRPNFPPSVKAKAKPAPGFFDSLAGNPGPLEQANAVPSGAPEAESITGPIGKARPLGAFGKASSSAFTQPSGLDVTADPSIIDEDGGPGGFPPEPNLAGMRPSGALDNSNSVETTSEEQVPDVSVMGPTPSLNTLGPDDDDDEFEDADSEDTDSEDADSEDSEDSNESMSADNEDSRNVNFDDSDSDEEDAREVVPKHKHPLIVVPSPIPALFEAPTTTHTGSSTPALTSAHTPLPSAQWNDGIFRNPTRPTQTDPPDADADGVKFLPFFLGPGPVVPPGVTLKWPGPYNLHHRPSPSARLMSRVSSVQTPSTLRTVTVPVVTMPWPTATEAVFSAVGFPGVPGSWPPAVPRVGALKGVGLRRAVVGRDRKESAGRA